MMHAVFTMLHLFAQDCRMSSSHISCVRSCLNFARASAALFSSGKHPLSELSVIRLLPSTLVYDVDRFKKYRFYLPVVLTNHNEALVLNFSTAIVDMHGFKSQ